MSDMSIKIGLEVHCQLTKLKSKLFCPCSSDYRDKEPNTNICPICMGLPGTLPTLNKEALFYALKVCLALNSEPNKRILFFRKNYYYPDLPKNFQITQYDRGGGVPFSSGGVLKLSSGKEIRIRRMNLEEDPAKIFYEGSITSSRYSLIDYNRAGIALLEIVTEPDMSNPKEAREFLERLKGLLEHLEVSEPDLEGAMRCDANISLMDGTRVEIKNISSFKEVEKALNFEIARQKALISKGIKVKRETRHWDEARRITVSLREKEEEEDYRYFPEPDLVPIAINEEMVKQIILTLPELPEKREKRYVKELGLSETLAKVIAYDRDLMKLFEDSLKYCNLPKKIGSWIVNDILAYLNRKNLTLKDLNLDANKLAKLAEYSEEYKVSDKKLKELLNELISGKKNFLEVLKTLKKEELVQKDEVLRIVDSVIKSNSKALEDYRKNKKVLDYFMGKVMEISKGKIDAKEVRNLLKEKIEEIIK